MRDSATINRGFPPIAVIYPSSVPFEIVNYLGPLIGGTTQEIDPLITVTAWLRVMPLKLVYLKHVNTNEIHFQEIVASGNVLQS